MVDPFNGSLNPSGVISKEKRSNSKDRGRSRLDEGRYVAFLHLFLVIQMMGHELVPSIEKSQPFCLHKEIGRVITRF